MKSIRRMMVVLIIMCLLPISISVISAEKQVNNVLVLHSYHKGLQWTDDIQIGIEASLGSLNVQYSIEYMDSYRHGETLDLSKLASYYASKYDGMTIDTVVVTDEFAYDFMKLYKDELFVDVPIVFAGVHKDEDSTLFRDKMVGIVSKTSFEETLALIHNLHPEVLTIIGLECNNPTNESEIAKLFEDSPSNYLMYEYVQVCEEKLEDQISKLRRYNPDTTAVIITGTLLEDDVFYDHGTYAGTIIDETGIPVYALSDVYLYNNGAIGGYVEEALELGIEIGNYVNRILEGEDVEEIGINTKFESSYMFNYDRLEEFDLARTDLPPNYKLVDGPEEALSLGKDFLIVLGILISVIVISMVLLVISSIRRKKAELILEEHANKLEHMAYHDNTTDLYNRAYLIEYLQKQLLDSKHTYTALYNLDVVNLKMINDAYGHDVGDRVLQHVADLLKEEFSSDEECIGIYHTELLIVDHTRDDLDDVKARINHLIRQLSHTTIIDYMEINIKVNVGIALAPEHSIDAKLLLKKANIALIESTKYGPNHYHVFEDTLYKDVLKRITLEKQLRRAVNNDEFVIFYQPRINMSDMTVGGCEALIRWNHPDGHLVYPNHFIPLAESVGFIEEITRWVIRRVSNQVMEWARNGYEIKVSFNISGKEFDDDFIHMLREVIKEIGVNPKLLEVEITETAALKDIDHSKILVNTLNDIGLSVALDDFGTGYSSMTYIKKLKASKLKIDKTFIDDIEEYEQKVVVDSMIQLGQKLNYRINVEGVETTEQLRILKYLKVDEIQGWLFSKAVPADDFIKYVDKMLDNKYKEPS